MPKKIRPPTCHTRHPDRDLICQEAIEAAFAALADQAEAAGWQEMEVADALVELAYNRWMAIDENRRMMEENGGALIPAAKLH